MSEPSQQPATTESVDFSKATEDVVTTGFIEAINQKFGEKMVDSSTRPLLLRNQQPAVPTVADYLVPADAAVTNSRASERTDSLSTTQMRSVVADIHEGNNPVAYDFTYSDTGLFEEELDEWFPSREWLVHRLQAAQRAFEDWQLMFDGQIHWEDANNETKENFVREALRVLQLADATQREPALGKILYIVLGRWAETSDPERNRFANKESRHVASERQVGAIYEGVRLLIDTEGLPIVWQALRNILERIW